MEKLTRVRFTNLHKILYPKLRVKKYQIIEYYIKVAPLILEFLEGRIVTLNRFPEGVDSGGFYMKDAPRGTPPWVETFTRYSETAGREINHIICDNLDTLLWLSNLASLEMHITLSRARSYDKPDMILFDLDPETPAGFRETVEAAFILKERLDALGLKSFVKTSGSKGLHVLLPIIENYTFRQTREYVHEFGKHLARRKSTIVSEKAQSNEPGRVYIDYIQNSSGRTMVCPYSLRAVPEATVSTPVNWLELESLDPRDLNIFSVMKRKGNPWKGFWEGRQGLEINQNDHKIKR